MKKYSMFLLFILLAYSFSFAETITVFAEGEIKKPGSYVLKKGSTLYDLIILAGGYTEDAYLRGARFLRNKDHVNLKDIKEDLLTKFCKTLEIKELPAYIRIPIELKHPRLLKNTKYDLVLMDGDKLVIPKRIDTISIIGAVRNPGIYPFDVNYDFDDYVIMAGGISTTKKTYKYIYKIDGNIKYIDKSLIYWNELENRWEFSFLSKDKLKLEPGDTIVIQEILEH